MPHLGDAATCLAPFTIPLLGRVGHDRIWPHRNMKVRLGGVCLLATGLTVTGFTPRGATPSTLVNAASQQQLPASPASPATSAQRALVDKYCVTCHNQRLKTAGLMLDRMDLDRGVPESAEVWEKVLRKLAGGMM